MSTPITFAAPHAFLGARLHDRGAAYCVAGIPLDIGTTNRAGTRDGPRAIRAAARMLTDGRHPMSGIDPTTLDLSDLGEFEIALGDIPESLRLIEQQAAGLSHLRRAGRRAWRHAAAAARADPAPGWSGRAWCMWMRISIRRMRISASATPMARCSSTPSRKG